MANDGLLLVNFGSLQQASADIQKGELQFLRDRCCAQFEEHARYFLPDVNLIKNRLPKARQRLPRAEINPLEDPLY